MPISLSNCLTSEGATEESSSGVLIASLRLSKAFPSRFAGGVQPSPPKGPSCWKKKDVPVPRGFFDLFAESVFGASGKRPQLMVRSWLTALLRLSLLQGSMADGLFFKFCLVGNIYF